MSAAPSPIQPPGYPTFYVSRTYTLFLLAEDDLPTYRNWTSACQPPIFNTTGQPPGPCDPVTVEACSNTAPAVDTNNPQKTPFSAWDATLSGASLPQPPVQRPLRVPVVVSDDLQVAFKVSQLQPVGASALVFSFAVTRPALVRYQLVRNVIEVLATGMFPVFDPAITYNVTLSRDCNGALLVPGTNYGLWYNASDIYGGFSPLRMTSQVLL